MPTPSYRRFDADLEAFARAIDADIGLVTRRVALQAFTGIVQKTPVDTGRAKSNWGINIGAPAPPPSGAVTEEEANRRKRDGYTANASAEDSKAIQEASSALAGVDGTRPVHITNNLPYIVALNQGHSKQAPAGFVEATVEEIAREIIDATTLS